MNNFEHANYRDLQGQPPRFICPGCGMDITYTVHACPGPPKPSVWEQQIAQNNLYRSMNSSPSGCL